jgi:hypothetical protein
MNLPNDHWQDTEAISARAFERSMSKAQAAHDAQMPPEDGPCEHKWRRGPGEAKDGTKFARCVKCGLEVES